MAKATKIQHIRGRPSLANGASSRALVVDINGSVPFGVVDGADRVDIGPVTMGFAVGVRVRG